MTAKPAAFDIADFYIVEERFHTTFRRLSVSFEAFWLRFANDVQLYCMYCNHSLPNDSFHREHGRLLPILHIETALDNIHHNCLSSRTGNE